MHTFYTPALHTEIVTRIQRVLDEGMMLAERLGITDQTKAVGDLPDGTTIDLSHVLVAGSIPYLKITWAGGSLDIQYRADGSVADTTSWNDDTYQGGHIQYSYSGEQHDPKFQFDFCALLNQVTNWKVYPISFID